MPTFVPETKFNDVKKAIAERNEAAHKQARELRAAREREQFGIVARHKVDLNRQPPVPSVGPPGPPDRWHVLRHGALVAFTRLVVDRAARAAAARSRRR